MTDEREAGYADHFAHIDDVIAGASDMSISLGIFAVVAEVVALMALAVESESLVIFAFVLGAIAFLGWSIGRAAYLGTIAQGLMAE